jgi:hypothetical protein
MRTDIQVGSLSGALWHNRRERACIRTKVKNLLHVGFPCRVLSVLDNRPDIKKNQ